MYKYKLGVLTVLLFIPSPASNVVAASTTPAATQALIDDALSAAPPTIAKTAAVKDWDGSMLREGRGDEYVCFPTHPSKRAQGGKEPMCFDKVWLAWADAWMNKKPFKAAKAGIAYMLAGDTGASNIDPYAEKKTSGNQWIVEGPHVMAILPDHTQLDAFSTDPKTGGAYVMWKGTPYAHIMMPVGERPKQ